MGEAIISRRGGGAPVLTWRGGHIDGDPSLSGLRSEKRYIVVAGEMDESLSNCSVGLWYLDRGQLVDIGGRHYEWVSSNTISQKDGAGVDLRYSDGRLSFGYNYYTNPFIAVAEIT